MSGIKGRFYVRRSVLDEPVLATGPCPPTPDSQQVMTHQIELKRITEPLLEALDETFNTTHGIYLDRNTSLVQTLASVSAEEASQAISPGTATIAAQVEHVRFYLDVLHDVIATKQIPKVDWREIWNTVTTVNSDEWENSKRRLEQSHQRVMDMINELDDWSGEYDIAGAISILAHTAYHLGGIRQALAAVRSRDAGSPGESKLL
ncbi:MAG: hypothetical protein C5B55_02315 [Blastocatellia bacterium]|nr:MAG: hypothetical protein C5B55_02315 [Blastocatellia bacterium]